MAGVAKSEQRTAGFACVSSGGTVGLFLLSDQQ